MSRVVVIGLGNPLRNDDAAGIEVVRRLRDAGVEGVELHVLDGEPLGLIDRWAGAEIAYVVDAVAGADAPGTIHRIEVDGEPLPDRPRRGSTHAVALGDVIELARALERLPRRIVVIGISGEDFAAGVGLTPRVADAVDEVVASLATAGQEGSG